MFTRIYKWLTAPFRAVKFAANKAEGYRYAKHLLATGAAGAEEHLEDRSFPQRRVRHRRPAGAARALQPSNAAY
jgi:hypothetical protein